MRRRLPVFVVLIAAITLISVALLTNHHAVVVFLNGGQPTGCGGG